MTTTAPSPASGSEPFDANTVRWDLDPLVEPFGGMNALFDQASERAGRLQVHKGNIAGLDAAGLAALLAELTEIRELAWRAIDWASLRQCTDMDDEARGADLQRATERFAQLGNEVLFFDLEWAALDDDAAEALLANERLAPWAQHLRVVRERRAHLLSEPEERILARKSVTGVTAWARLFTELCTAITVQLDAGGEDVTVTLEQALSSLYDADRAVRRNAHQAITTALAPGLRTRAYILNTLLADKSTDDELRRFPTWISSRNLENQASDESVEALVAAVQRRYDLPQRWYRLKAKVLGVERMADYDRYAAIGADDDARYEFPAARRIVLDAFARFSPQIADAARMFFDEGWIDAGARPGKQGGAFCAYTVPSHHPYVLLNWTERRSDVLTLAHELGHGVHAWLARGQNVFSQSTPLTLAETASVFGETLTFGALLEQTTTPLDRLGLLASSIEGGIATVFRQTAMNRFEDAVHTARRTTGELSVEQFNECWARTQGELFGEAMEVTEGYRSWWSYVPHFVHTPGYVYAYAYGQLLAMSVYRQSQVQGPDFTSRYLHLLSAGGSLPPEELGRIVGCDLADPGFWDGGLGLLEAQIDAAETAAAEAGLLR